MTLYNLLQQCTTWLWNKPVITKLYNLLQHDHTTVQIIPTFYHTTVQLTPIWYHTATYSSIVSYCNLLQHGIILQLTPTWYHTATYSNISYGNLLQHGIILTMQQPLCLAWDTLKTAFFILHACVIVWVNEYSTAYTVGYFISCLWK